MSAQLTEEQTVPAVDASAKEHPTLAAALVAAQREMPSVDRDQTNPHFKSKFASLGNLLTKARPVLNRNGIVLVQAPMLDESGRFVLRTTILHSSGEKMAFDSPLKPTKDDPQGQGSAITYMRRYALAAALAIADQEDDDGNAGSARAEGTPQATARERKASERPITGAQKGKVNALMAEAELAPEQASAVRVWWCSMAACDHFDRLPSKSASDLIDTLGEDGSGAFDLLDKLKRAAVDGHEVAQKIVARMEEAATDA